MASNNGSGNVRLDEVRQQLAQFLTNNTISKIDELNTPSKDVAVQAPWGEDSLAIVVPSTEAEDLIDGLNRIYLPERFTAIWHIDTQALEIIYSILPSSHPSASRHFVFKHRGCEYRCAFRESSKVLLSIARNYRPIGASSTIYRNLTLFNVYAVSQETKVPTLIGSPISFWIEGITWEENAVLDLARHLNFYMYYYDRQTAQIVIHPAKSESVLHQPQSRYPYGSFPTSIVSRELDDALLQFWAASISGDPVRRFLYNYQILEYAAFFYIEENIKREIRRALAAPHATDNLNALTEQVIEALAESKIPDPQKLDNLLRATVDYKLIREIEGNLKLFSAAMTFDGGFVLQPLMKDTWTADDFKSHWIPAFSNTLRSIRNALSHGREQRMTAVITPTTANFHRLQPWISPIAVAAREVMQYRDLV